MSGVNFFSYFIPCCTKHHAAKDFMKLNGVQQFLVLLATAGVTIASIPILGTGGIATFRKIVKDFKNHNAQKADAVFKKSTDPKPTKKPIEVSSEELIELVLKKITLEDEESLEVEAALNAVFAQNISGTKEFQEMYQQFKAKLQGKISEEAIGHAAAVLASSHASLFMKGTASDSANASNPKKVKPVLPKINNPATSLGYLAGICPQINNLTKRAMYIQAINLFEQVQQNSTIQEIELGDNKPYELNKKSYPLYFSKNFEDKGITVTETEEYYSYVPDPDQTVFEYYVDFANMCLGGHIDGSYAQEEKMIAEMPNLMNYIASTLGDDGMSTVRVRDGKSSVGKGTPNPKIYENCIRVQALGGYGTLPSLDEFSDNAIPLAAPQVVNVLAMAAPSLSSASFKRQLSMDTAVDLFNTFHAGFSLVAANPKQGKTPLVHTGKIGCGVFNNNPILVYLLQRLAASQLGVDLYFHGYKEDELIAANGIWDGISDELEGKNLAECVELIVEAVKTAKKESEASDSKTDEAVTNSKKQKQAIADLRDLEEPSGAIESSFKITSSDQQEMIRNLEALKGEVISKED